MNRLRVLISTVALFLSFATQALSQETVILNDSGSGRIIGRQVLYLEDKAGELNIQQVSSGAYDTAFRKPDKPVIYIGITESVFWIKLKVKNADPEISKDLLVDESQISNIQLFEPAISGKMLFETGFLKPFSGRPVKITTYALPLKLADTLVHTYFLRIHSNRPIILPLSFVTEKELLLREGKKNTGYGIYFGIFAGLFLYNLFLFIGLKDRAYLYYLFSIFSSFLMFASVTGYTLVYFFPSYPLFNRVLIEVGAAFLSISSALFAREFLNIKKYSRVLTWLLYGCMAAGVFALGQVVSNHMYTSMEILYNLLSVQIFIMLACGIVSWRKGNSYASYYIIAWIGYMIGGLLILVRDIGVLPYSNLTIHSAEAGSALEIVLLSLALSKKYQTYRKEKEEATKEALRIQKEANETLENKVVERTSELQLTLSELKSTQVQLIQAEKMASLGVMTAGVAHEINNPVNYVSAGLATLRQNYDDMKEIIAAAMNLNPGVDKAGRMDEISQMIKEKEMNELLPEMDFLFNSVNNGTHKISEIVKGLRNFTRLDEGEAKTVSLEDGLDATLSMLSEKLGTGITIEKDYGHIPPVYCLASQINQVFMNIIYNAIDAMSGNGTIYLKTEAFGAKKVRIKIRDTGNGIPEEIKSRVFDPFFTTKDVGKGTGLGLSVSYNIIEKHKGALYFNASPGKGTEFVIELDEYCQLSN